MYPLFLGTTELILVLAVVVLLFGAAKLPDLARGTGRALRIFKTETKGLIDDDSTGDKQELDSGESEESAERQAERGRDESS